MFTELYPGIYCVSHRWVDGNNGILLGTHRAAAIDTGAYPDEGQAMAGFIRAQGYRPDRLILTHGHVDHVRGGPAFAQAEVFAHWRTPDVIHGQIPTWAKDDGISVEEEIAQTIWPTVTFRGDLWLDLGERTLHLFPTPGHSQDGICVYLPQEQVLFAGDVVATGIAPALNDGDSREMEQSLQRLLDLEIVTLVPGHGPILQSKDAIQDWLRWVLGYLSQVRSYVRQSLRRGDNPREIAAAADYDRLIGDRLPMDEHNMITRHRMAVTQILHEEIAEQAV